MCFLFSSKVCPSSIVLQTHSFTCWILDLLRKYSETYLLFQSSGSYLQFPAMEHDSSWVVCIFAHFKRRHANCFCSSYCSCKDSFLVNSLGTKPWSNEQRLLILMEEIVCPFGRMEALLTVYHKDSCFQTSEFLSSVMQSVAHAGVIWLSSYHPVGIGCQGNNLNTLIYLRCLLSHK